MSDERDANQRDSGDAARLLTPDIKRVLVVRLDEIGDMVLSTPFFRELRRNLPSAHITLLVKPGAVGLVQTSPHVDEILTFDWLHRRVYLRPDRYPRLLAFWWRRLRGRPFDLALLPRRGVDYYSGKLLVMLSRAPLRVGFAPIEQHREEPNALLTRGGNPYFTHVLRHCPQLHEVESSLDVIRAMGGQVRDTSLDLHVTDDDHQAVDALLSRYAVEGDRLVALAPGAGARRREWPLERFQRIAAWLSEQYGARPVVVGGRTDSALGDMIGAAAPGRVINMAGLLSLRQTSALLGRCSLFVGNNTGPLHLAAAAGTPTVEISCHPRSAAPAHVNSPLWFGSWAVERAILQPEQATPPCRQGCRSWSAHCIKGVSVEDVQEAIMRMWSDTAVRRERSEHAPSDRRL